MKARLFGGTQHGKEIFIFEVIPVILASPEERYIYWLTDDDTGTAIYWAETEEDRRAAEFNQALETIKTEFYKTFKIDKMVELLARFLVWMDKTIGGQ